MKTALDQTLAPCPFCGGEASMRNGGPGCFFVQCDLCNATSDDRAQDTAIAAWNRRAALPSGPVTEDEGRLTAIDRLRLHLEDAETFVISSDDLEGVVEEFDTLRAALVRQPGAVTGYVACIACEGSPKAPNDPCGLCGTSSAPAVAEPGIRALEWRGPVSGFWDADTIGGVTEIMWDHHPGERYILNPSTPERRDFSTLDAAKAAAQADYEARIRSVLTSPKAEESGH